MSKSRPSPSNPESKPFSVRVWILISMALFVVLLAVLVPRQGPSTSRLPSTNADGRSTTGNRSSQDPAHSSPGFSGASLTPEEIVARKVTQFAQDRLGIARAMAERFKVSVAPDVERFFQAAATGNWEELSAAFEALKQRRESGHSEDLNMLWGPILETLLISECAHDWPAQKLLDYGNATLGSLRPGMVYVGGTDPGRGIPTLLNETSDGEKHIVITQNALADLTYLQYVDFLYGDRVAALTKEESERAFRDYVADAQKRLLHDQQFPDEEKQIRPGENVRMVDSRLEVSGEIAVMAINEILLRTFMDKNPDLSFALEESFPLKSTYHNAAPLGHIMELGVEDVQNSFDQEAARQAANYWRDAAQQFSSDGDAPNSAARMTYAKMAAAQAALLADHQYVAEAEQAFRIAVQISPSSPEAVYGLGQLLAKTERADEAHGLLADFERAYPPKDPAPAWLFNYKADDGVEAPHP